MGFFSSLFKGIFLKTEQTSESGYAAPPDLSKYIGRTTRTETVLRPAGAVRLDGRRFDAVAECDYIDEDVPVKVTGTLSAALVVIPLEDLEEDQKEK